ncbi:thioredoxin-like protein [Rhodovulum bhavnagarense]|uniref:Thioredoxin-like protein n=1 Tax=Rhodovulum bhavnagarense TaxID=992286 RepID=A0A4R2RHE9_9RHOB|nr:thioredoxin domain-containing protein [Rhodovulum bhavnagarense]TCP61869.1 thioredoxin-like protein [Rhodovulum bhavnagarense]
MRYVPLLTILALAASPVPALELTQAERTAFGEAVRTYLLTHPEVIGEAMQRAEARRQANHAAGDIALLQANARALFHAPGDWSGGAAKGDLTLVSFIDYRDAASARALEAAQALIAKDGALRWVIKQAPAPGNTEAERAARFALAVLWVAGGEVYRQAQAALFAAPDASPATLSAIALDLGLSPERIAAQMADPRIDAHIDATRALADRLELGPAPAQVLDRAMVRGDVPAVALARIVDALRRQN